ncbi:MAG: Rne/Rng family ribonuclease [Paracoccaceae bacterium]
MGKKLLIDATHAEETRVVVVDGNKVEEFDFETIHKRQLAGNIYLAKVTRVEPSLQAAFVDYGGNRHGFLAFAEIHPDYYQIPTADRQALLEEERALVRAQDDDGASRKPRKVRRKSSADGKPADEASDDVVAIDDIDSGAVEAAADVSTETVAEPAAEITIDETDAVNEADAAEAPVSDAPVSDAPTPEEPAADVADEENRGGGTMAAQAEGTDHKTFGSMDIVDLDDTPAEEDEPYVAAHHASDVDDQIESVAEEDIAEEVRLPRRPRARRYKIQEVIKVRQIMLVQVVKEERGNKGAALTTYLSLAGRYCVLMPNTARGGGISRKITNAVDRKKLKEIASEFDVPEGAGLIIRTAGANRTKAEIKRDYEYLFRLWEQIRDLTLRSIAPAPIYEEGDLIKRSIRDLYNKDIDEVLVEGEAGYRTAKDFMKMIMPSHARNVKQYAEQMPLFARYQVESYLGSMFNPVVQLKSGGYIVIGVTEALVAIDVNSGKSTREGSIEDTALKTNLEASEEIARQLRLRDLAGLIVIDFIDMEERKNNAAVEKRLKDKLKDDRARIQVGRISGFGLLEMSRQRLRPGMLEATTQPCPHCHGTGLIRSDNSLALQILRALEEEGTRNRSKEVLVKAPVGIVNYLFNQKREHLAQIEVRYGMAIRIEADPALVSPDYSIEKFKTATRIVSVQAAPVVSLDVKTMADIDDELAIAEEDEVEDDEVEAPAAAPAVSAEGDDAKGDGSKRKRRRRRRRRGGQGADAKTDESADANGADDGDSDEGDGEAEAPADTGADAEVTAAPQAVEEPAPKKRTRARRKPKAEAAAEIADVAEVTAEEPAAAEVEAPKKRTRTRRKPKAEAEAPVETADEAPAEIAAEATPEAEAVAEPVAEAAVEPAVETAAEAPVEMPAETAAETAPEAVAEVQTEVQPEPQPAPEPEAPAKPRRSGWWSRNK